jgi:hypothetical protein
MEEYFIEEGVRRAVAAREAGVTKIFAVVHEPGHPPKKMAVNIDALHSPKAAISASDPRYLKAAQGMQTALARAGVPPIDVQLLGEPGQPRSIPLSQVRLDP